MCLGLPVGWQHSLSQAPESLPEDASHRSAADSHLSNLPFCRYRNGSRRTSASLKFYFQVPQGKKKSCKQSFCSFHDICLKYLWIRPLAVWVGARGFRVRAFLQLVGMRMLWGKARRRHSLGSRMAWLSQKLSPGARPPRSTHFPSEQESQAFQEVTFLGIDVFPFFSRLGFYPGSWVSDVLSNSWYVPGVSVSIETYSHLKSLPLPCALQEWEVQHLILSACSLDCVSQSDTETNGLSHVWTT